ncbi:MAG: FliO/MopB family protein [Candidatus Methylomirabilia bacterium]
MSVRASVILAAILLAPLSGAWAAEMGDGPTIARPAAGEGPSLTASLWRLGVACLVVAGLLYGGSRLIRRLPLARYLPGGDGSIQIEGRTILGPSQSLCLVRAGPWTVLIGVTSGRIVPLHAWAQTEAPASSQRPREIDKGERSFPSQLRLLQDRLGGGRR